jgi:CarD family transcriptional regulator
MASVNKKNNSKTKKVTQLRKVKATKVKSSGVKKTPGKTASTSKSTVRDGNRKPAKLKTAKKTATNSTKKKTTVKPSSTKSVKKTVTPTVKIAPTAPRKLHFKNGDFVVYPTHGVGQIEKVDEQHVAGVTLELYVIAFEKDKMILRVPTAKAKSVGMRKLSSPDVVSTALNTLKGRARIKRTMWSRRAQEYEAKINSGDLVSIAEVVRDLHRAGGQPEQSYSERQLYEAALARMAREVAAIERIDEEAAVGRVEAFLLKKAA